MHRRLWYPFESVIGPVHDYPFVDSYEVPFRFPTLNHVLTDNSASPTTKDDGLGAGAIVAIIIGVLVLLGTHLATHAMCVHPASFFATKAHTHAFKHTGAHTCMYMHKRAHAHPRAACSALCARVHRRPYRLRRRDSEETRIARRYHCIHYAHAWSCARTHTHTHTHMRACMHRYHKSGGRRYRLVRAGEPYRRTGTRRIHLRIRHAWSAIKYRIEAQFSDPPSPLLPPKNMRGRPENPTRPALGPFVLIVCLLCA